MNVTALVEVLLDKHARWDERDDAATDLAGADAPKALRALLGVGCDGTQADALLAAAGESLAEMLARHPEWRASDLSHLAATASRAFHGWNEATQRRGQVPFSTVVPTIPSLPWH